MTAVILDGKHVAQLTEEQLSERVEALKAKSDGRTPVLATILVGDDPASATYVKMKGNACRRVGMESMAIELPASTRTCCNQSRPRKWRSLAGQGHEFRSRFKCSLHEGPGMHPAPPASYRRDNRSCPGSPLEIHIMCILAF